MIKDLQCIIQQIQTQSTICKFSDVWELDRLLSLCWMFQKQRSFNMQHVWESNGYWSSTQRNVVAIMETKPWLLVTKDEMLIAMVTTSVAISSPWMPFENTIPVLSLQPYITKELKWPFLVFLGVISDCNAGFLQWQAQAETLRTIRGSLLNERHALHCITGGYEQESICM